MAQKLTIRVVDRRDLEVPSGVSIREIVTDHLGDDPTSVFGAVIDEEVVPLDYLVKRDRLSLRLITRETEEALELLRNTASSILAHAVKELFPAARLGFGSATGDGFYRDFLVDEPFTWEDLSRIEERMRAVVEEDLPIHGRTVSRFEGLAELGKLGEHLLLEYLESIHADEVRFDHYGGFSDLARKPLMESTGQVANFRLLNLSSVLWLGDDNRPRLQRISGAAFFSEDDIRDFLKENEERLKRDHRRIGRELGLFSFPEHSPAGMPTWLPPGEKLRMTFGEMLHRRFDLAGYQSLGGPLILRGASLPRSVADNKGRKPFRLSGDWANAELRADQLPGALGVFGELCQSHRDLPLRLYEMSTVLKDELSGTLHGLFRTREYTLAQAHVFCAREEFKEEFGRLVDFSRGLLEWLGFSLELELTPGSGAADSEEYDPLKDFQSMLDVCGDIGLRCKVVKPGDSPSHRAKLLVGDKLDRTWTHMWIDLHYAICGEAGLSFRDAEDKLSTPLLLTANVPGPLERLLAILMESCNGEFPFWLAPRQILVIPITRKETDAARRLSDQLKAAGWRCEVDPRQESMGAKVRRAELNKVPMMAILGKREVASGTCSLRIHGKGEMGEIAIDRLSDMAGEEYRTSFEKGFGIGL